MRAEPAREPIAWRTAEPFAAIERLELGPREAQIVTLWAMRSSKDFRVAPMPAKTGTGPVTLSEGRCAVTWTWLDSAYGQAWRAEWSCEPEPVVAESPRAIVAEVFADVPNQAAAIVDCETGGTWNTYAIGRYGERGLFQIHPIHGALIRSLGYTWDDMFDPEANARVARALYERSGWTPWACSALQPETHP